MSELVWGRHRETHNTPETTWSLCNNCEHLWCRRYDKSLLHPYKYHCDAAHKNLSTKEMYEMIPDKCPIGRKKVR